MHYRNQPIKVLATYQNGVTKELAYDTNKDNPLDCFKVPRIIEDFEYMQTFAYTMCSLKQLQMSKYFVKFLGFDDLSDPNYNLYFFERRQGFPLSKLLYSVFPLLLLDETLNNNDREQEELSRMDNYSDIGQEKYCMDSKTCSINVRIA